jgi:hypothetical protein
MEAINEENTHFSTEEEFQEHQGTIITHTIDQSNFREESEVQNRWNSLQEVQFTNQIFKIKLQCPIIKVEQKEKT